MSDAIASDHPSFTKNWLGYYQAVTHRPPRETLLAALDAFPPEFSPGFAVDLGCGQGRDTIELLRRGWRVLAIDGEAQAVEGLKARTDLPNRELLETQVAFYQQADWPEADLVNSSFALPFCKPEDFPLVWQKIERSLQVGGRFCGQLFGNRDSWATSAITTQTREAALALFTNFELEMFTEEEHDGVTALGDTKYWHIFHVVACKK